jgi:hypothetical protein
MDPSWSAAQAASRAPVIWANVSVAGCAPTPMADQDSM